VIRQAGTCILFDLAVSGDRNVMMKEDEKILKHKGLTRETQNMWNIKTKAIPVITGATGTNWKMVWKIPEQNTGKRQIKELQKTASWSLHIKCASRSTLLMQITQYSTRRVTLLVALNVNTELLQHYNPRNMVCVGYVVENTLCKSGGGSSGNNN